MFSVFLVAESLSQQQAQTSNDHINESNV